MYSRKYSLKTRYNFRKTLSFGQTYKSFSLIIKYSKSDTLKFGIITSNRFSKRAVDQNRVRRLISEAIRINIGKFPQNFTFIFIPKKTILEDVKLGDNVKNNGLSKKIFAEIDTFLSKMVFD
ncbi:hypothetical protein CO178_02135 [candidate division WWE3 bacterium CG_4_9_14_3_um_filter_34_6]|uniref:Ribonuclease P protein component n=1 Tax=candidate division WWE3 bacterium CG_4_9_14_3_um_filter_34_6 TaxID=1975079 RepID=A0A2M7X2R6_UNCKA|nr:MAG: hypothetical protein CO178_02135 [candidate division WWE3 bacterium CG_4_9_14_3_um_filter_34_6]